MLGKVYIDPLGSSAQSSGIQQHNKKLFHHHAHPKPPCLPVDRILHQSVNDNFIVLNVRLCEPSE